MQTTTCHNFAQFIPDILLIPKLSVPLQSKKDNETIQIR